MINVAFIPVRGGSKSIPMKNIKSINRKPLVYWAIQAAVECTDIDKVYVSTDSAEIKKVIESFNYNKVDVIERSAETATDSASTEMAMLEFAISYSFENIILIQATSPLITSEDLHGGMALFMKDKVDSVLSVVRQKRFIWGGSEITDVKPINYDVYNRPRRQEFDGFLVENGAFYITSRQRLLDSRNRLSGRIAAYEMNEDTYFEIDEPSDWVIIENIMRKRENTYGLETLPDIKMFLTDCDGCLTDGGMYYSENGDELKKFNTRDGVGFELLRKKEIVTGIITGEERCLNQRRANKLQVDILSEGCKDKLSEIRRLCIEYNISIGNVCYIGDDLNDLEALELVGYSCCPSDAVKQVKDVVSYVAEAKGGKGVIREIAEIIINNKVLRNK